MLEASKSSCTFLVNTYKAHGSKYSNSWDVFILPFPSPCARHPALHGLDFERSPVSLQNSWSRGPPGGMLLTSRSGKAFLQGPCRLSVEWSSFCEGPDKGEIPPEAPHSPACNPRRQLVAARRRRSQRSLPTRNERVARMPKGNGLHFSFVTNKKKQQKCD